MKTKKAANEAREVAKLVRNRGNLNKMEYNTILEVVKVVLRAYDDYSEYIDPPFSELEKDGYVIDQLIEKDQVYGVTHELLKKINFYSTEFTLKKRGLINKDR